VGGRSGHPARPVDLLLVGIVSVVAGCGGNDLGQAAASSRPTTSTAGTTTTRATATSATAAHTVTTTRPRRSGGYFRLVPAGRWSVLPSGATCRHRVHASSWEPRPDNTKRNHVMPDSAAVHAAFAARPRAAGGAADPRWDSWLLARVDGRFTGTTDETFQWGACKWGLPDDLLRAVAVDESTWYQYLTYPSGRAVPDYGSGDVVSVPSAASRIYCGFVARFGHDYQRDLGSGRCPQTFSIVGVKSWQDPAWGPGRTTRTGPSRSIATPPPSRWTIWVVSCGAATRAGSPGCGSPGPAARLPVTCGAVSVPGTQVPGTPVPPTATAAESGA
jgi:hypothetical protein